MMTKSELQAWIVEQVGALALTDAEKAEARAQIAALLRGTHGATMRDHREAIDGCVFAPIREARAKARMEAEYAARTTVQGRTPAQVASEMDAVTRAAEAWMASLARRERRAGRLAA